MNIAVTLSFLDLGAKYVRPCVITCHGAVQYLRQRLDFEMQYFPSIASSILEVISRSENRGFLSKCKRLLKVPSVCEFHY